MDDPDLTGGAWQCLLCPEQLADVLAAINHGRLIHPDVWDGLDWWPDDRPVTVDATLAPSDFGGEA